MAKFYQCSNNEVIAIMPSEQWEVYQAVIKFGGDPVKAGIRIFTFSNNNKATTGTREDMNFLLMRHEIAEKGFFVPFSNGSELGLHGDKAKNEELRYQTTLSDVIKFFLTAKEV